MSVVYIGWFVQTSNIGELNTRDEVLALRNELKAAVAQVTDARATSIKLHSDVEVEIFEHAGTIDGWVIPDAELSAREPMNERRAREILIQSGDLSTDGDLALEIDERGFLDADLYADADQLEAIAWCMRNKGKADAPRSS